jgi:hypothetical protein
MLAIRKDDIIVSEASPSQQGVSWTFTQGPYE